MSFSCSVSASDEQVSRLAVMFMVSSALFLMPFMLSSVGVALPSIGREMHASAIELGLVETVYVLTVATFMLVMGRMGDLYGRRRIFIIGVTVFTAATTGISFASSMEQIIALRFFQGLGASMVNASSMAILVAVYPRELRGRALGIVTGVVYAGVSCGPVIGGFLTSSFGWRSIFVLSIPLGIGCLYCSVVKMRKEWREAKGESFDWKGGLVQAFSMAALAFGATRQGEGGLAPYILFAGFSGLILFFVIEANTKYPVLDVRLLRHNRVFSLSCLASMINYASTFAVTFFMSLYLQYVKGMSPRDAGLILVIQPLLQMALSPFAGRLSDSVSPARVATGGMGLCALALALASTIGAETSLFRVVGTLCLLGLGYALFSSPNATVIMSSVDKKHLGVASGMTGTVRTMGMMISMVMVTITFSLYMGGEPVSEKTLAEFILSMQHDLLCFVGLSLIGIFCSFGRIGTPDNSAG